MTNFYPGLQLATILLWVISSVLASSVAAKKFFHPRTLAIWTFCGALLQFFVACFLFYKKSFDGIDAAGLTEHFTFSTDFFSGISSLGMAWDFTDSTAFLWLVFTALGAIFFLPKAPSGSGLDPVLLWSPLAYLGVFLGILGKDLLTSYFGWSLVAGAQFLSLAFFKNAKASRFSSRFLVVSLLGEVVFLGGLVYFATIAGTVDVSAIKSMPQKAPELFFPAILVGMGFMMRAFLFPVAQLNWLAVGAGRSSAFYTLLAKITLLTGAVIQVFPLFQLNADLRYLALLPMLSGLFTALCMLVPRSGELFVSLAASCVMSTVFLLAWTGSAQGVLLVGASGMIALFGFHESQSRLKASPEARKILVWFFVFALLGLPATLVGWAKYATFKSLVVVQEHGSTLQWMLVQGTLLAELVFGMAIWTKARSASFEKEDQAETDWVEYVLLCLVGIATIAVTLGGKPLGALVGYDFPAVEIWAWLSNLVATLPDLGSSTSPSELLDNSEVFVRVIVGAILVLPIFIAHVWYAKDKSTYEHLSAGLSRFLDRSFSYDEERGLLYVLILKPLGRWIALGARWVEHTVNEEWVPRVFAFPRSVFRVFSKFVEDLFFDGLLIDGSWNVVRNLSRAVKLVHVGRVQFYLVVGIATLIALAVRLKGG